MERRDYILREIEKIGAIINAIRQKIFGSNGNLSLTFEDQIENTKEMFLNEVNFSLDKLLDSNTEDSNEYVCSFLGFSIENIELLAEFLSQIGFQNSNGSSRKYLEKAMQLYELCKIKSKTFSFERESNIKAIEDAVERIEKAERTTKGFSTSGVYHSDNG